MAYLPRRAHSVVVPAVQTRNASDKPEYHVQISEAGRILNEPLDHQPRGDVAEEIAFVCRPFGVPIIPTAITQSIVRVYAAAEGLTASEREPKGKAADEIAQAYNWIEGNLLHVAQSGELPDAGKVPVLRRKRLAAREGGALSKGPRRRPHDLREGA